MRGLRLLLPFVFAAGAWAAAPAAVASAPAGWDRVGVEPMKTSIVVGRVTLTPGVFRRKASTLAAGYEAKVFPWFFLSESGRISIELAAGAFARLAAGRPVSFTGEAINRNGQARAVTGLAQPTGATAGKIRVTIMANGLRLTFDSTYHLLPGATTPLPR